MSTQQWAHKVAAFDAFPKVEADNQTRSEKGGFLTVILACFLVLLTMSEFSEYRKMQTNYHFLVDSTIETTIPINMDLTVAMPCPAKYSAISNPTYIHEIVKAASGKKYDERIAADMGACRIFGSIRANKVAANLHITSLGHGYHSHEHTEHSLLNFTHRIDEFSFGQFYAGLVNPLDNSVEVAESSKA
ncbi:hypothetical protein DFQ30_004813 [Apophysomyces sp. BC1015]|nr:hypothetical protein DFQ30_004813 [Apophysomyces sp. BC1015]